MANNPGDDIPGVGNSSDDSDTIIDEEYAIDYLLNSTIDLPSPVELPLSVDPPSTPSPVPQYTPEHLRRVANSSPESTPPRIMNTGDMFNAITTRPNASPSVYDHLTE